MKGFRVVYHDMAPDTWECLDCHHTFGAYGPAVLYDHHVKRIPHAGILISECEANRISAD
jgi:hypothetical protein